MECVRIIIADAMDGCGCIAAEKADQSSQDDAEGWRYIELQRVIDTIQGVLQNTNDNH